MYERYGDEVQFFMVYIREAHAADNKWPSPIADEETIYNPRSMYERRAVASKCVGRLEIDIPCLIDDMDNSVDQAYDAYPDRLFIVDVDGTLAVRAGPGPWGFKPAVTEATQWLKKRFPHVEYEGEVEEPNEKTTSDAT